ncbi:helix-turn-helix domain-containing protein [Mycobacterium gordonae]|uniref:helix-turn-helix domain-containing protein n=1 Tax=Mycobacterium gordonae TaxID=1778 RepID=UPI0009F57AA1|nr:helix-turn-helix domain-containing protein [Mycobacterium gordonae]MCV7004409.1 helix-turn-helix domain-containing protein [Mycobacterium gordonae]
MSNFKTYSIDEVAEGLDCTPRWLTEQVRSGRFPAIKIARHWRFTSADVEAIFSLCANNFDRGAGGSVTVPDVARIVGLTPRSRRRVLGL